ncbi:MAG TPA: type VI secretion system tip protein TssI/VgrG [Gemmata sp.]|nr:type VI secretion system tip protein TssI/VgrG [Gemmata sp.]
MPSPDALKGHPTDTSPFVLTAVEHEASEPLTAGVRGGGGVYQNTFTAIPASVPFRPERRTPRPLIAGMQPAVVVGPENEEIYTDQYGRVKVHFPWDRVGAKDGTDTCWLRVAELWGGANWGVVFTPRVGQEVLVEFLEGDPDRPVVTGRVYNAEQMPPYALPANQTQSGIKSRSTKQGTTDDFNELRFEDKKDNEQIYFHAQKDFVRVVENDDSLNVGHDQSIEVKNNRTLVVKEGYEKITIEKGNRDRTVSKGDDSLTVTEGKRTVSVKADYAVTVQEGNRSITVSKGNETHTVSKGNLSVDVTAGDATIQAGNSITLKVGSNSIVIDTSSITLTFGGSSIKLDSSSIALNSTKVDVLGTTTTVSGDSQVKVSGAMAEFSGSATCKLSGGMVQIN